MMFLVSSRHEGSVLTGMTEADLLRVRNAIRHGFESTLIHASYAFAGGGSFWIIEAETELVVARLLAELGVKNAEVTPVVRTLDLVEAHIEHRRNTGVAAHPALPYSSGPTA